MSHQDSHASRSSSKKPRRNVPKSSSCDGLGMVDARFERLCASSGISVPPRQVARSRSISLTSPASAFLNWSLCPTSVEDRLPPPPPPPPPPPSPCGRVRRPPTPLGPPAR